MMQSVWASSPSATGKDSLSGTTGSDDTLEDPGVGNRWDGGSQLWSGNSRSRQKLAGGYIRRTASHAMPTAAVTSKGQQRDFGSGQRLSFDRLKLCVVQFDRNALLQKRYFDDQPISGALFLDYALNAHKSA